MRGVALVIVCGLARAASGDPPSEQVSDTTFHGHQFGLSVRFGVGYRALFTNDNQTYCGVTDASESSGNAKACTGRSPFALDLEASYGVARSIEVTLELRIGLEKDFGSSPAATDGPHQLQLSPGARFFFSEAKHAKLFVQPMAVLDFTGYKDHSFDLGIRSNFGLWIDLHKAYGIYFFLGPTIELMKFFQAPPVPQSRWLDAEFEAGFGIQGRYP